MKKIQLLFAFIICLSSLATQTVDAQDIHFSQFYMSPLHLNPAMTGVIGCDHRITANYRNQWASVLKSNAFRTYSASYDTRVAVGKSDYAGIGGSFWSDQVGTAAFSTLQGNLSGSYIKRLGGRRSNESYLVAGGQIGYAQRSIDASKLIYGDQWDGGSGISGPSLEAPLDPSFGYVDLSAGLMWFGALDRESKYNLYGGLAFHHLNRANMSFTGNTFESLYSKFTFHGGGEFQLNTKLALLPGVVYFKQGPSFESNLGTAVKFRFGNRRDVRQAVHLGTWVRLAGHYENAFLSDAVIFNARFDYNDFSLGFSYDVNVSSLRPATNSNGAFEMALNYKICTGKKRNLGCPDF